MQTMKNTSNIKFLVMGLLTLGACTGEGITTDDPTLPPATEQPGGTTTGGDGNTFDHDNSGVSAWDLIDRLQKEGPPKYTSRMHSCPKVKYSAIGNILASRGVDISGAGGALSAGGLYQSGNNALGVADYSNRIRENLVISTSGASRLFDIFAAAAPEVIAAMPNLEACKVAGVSSTMFGVDAQNTAYCRAEGIACLTGAPATGTAIDLCNLTLQKATNPTVGKNMAVAVLMAAAHTCE
jgi:hypothetical protein